MRSTDSGLVVSAGMVDRVADRAGVEVAELVAAAVEAALVIVAMNGAVRVVRGAAMVMVRHVVSGSRVARVVMIEVVRVGSGSRVARAAMNGVVHVVMIEVKTGEVRVVTGSRVVKVEMNVVARVVTTVVVRVVMTAVRDSVMIAMMRQSPRRSSVARRCLRVRARASTAKTNRLPTAKIGMSVSSTRARFVASAFGVANPSARSAGRGGIEVARRSQHRLRLRIPWRGKYGKPLAIGVMTL